MKDTTPLERVPTGWPYVHSLTPRQVMVIEHMSQGQSNNEIAAALDIKIGTVISHLKAIRIKLQVVGKGRDALIAAYLATRASS